MLKAINKSVLKIIDSFMVSSKGERLLREVYYDTNHPAGYSNARRLYNAVKKETISYKEVQEFLRQQRSHQFTRPNRYRFIIYLLRFTH